MLPPASQGTVTVIRPQEHEIVTGDSHLKSGQGAEGWQSAWQVCLQSLLGAPHTCPQEPFAAGSDGPLGGSQDDG